jgi:hypothetical protein
MIGLHFRKGFKMDANGDIMDDMNDDEDMFGDDN